MRPAGTGELRQVEHGVLPEGQRVPGAFGFFAREVGVSRAGEGDDRIVRVAGRPAVVDLLLEPAEVVGRGGEQHAAQIETEPAQDGFPRAELELVLAGLVQPGGLGGGGFKALRIERVAKHDARRHVGYIPKHALSASSREGVHQVALVHVAQLEPLIEQAQELRQGLLLEQREGGRDDHVVAGALLLDLAPQPEGTKRGLAALRAGQHQDETRQAGPGRPLAAVQVQAQATAGQHGGDVAPDRGRMAVSRGGCLLQGNHCRLAFPLQ
jgi:hypothetical protein